MGLSKTDGMATISVAEWNRKQSIRTIRNRILVRTAAVIVCASVVAAILLVLHYKRIITLQWW